VKIIINGAGIAGPTLAYWLERGGHEVLLVEAAPRLRAGGYIIDFWGVGYDVAEKMGLIGRIKDKGYQVGEVRFVDRHGRIRGGFPTDVIHRQLNGRFTSLRRSDLSAAIYDKLDGKVETIFGDSVAGIEDLGSSVLVRFDQAPPREADLVVGADGLHSRVRRLAFRPADVSEVSLGYQVAAFEAEDYQPRDELIYVSHGEPGRQISRFSMRDDRTLFLFVWRRENQVAPNTSSDEERRAVLSRVFAGMGWEWPRIEVSMADAGEIYLDDVCQIRMARWTSGRTALIGDASACVSLLAGEGAGLAMAEAYVLAGELIRCQGDHAVAFDRYERLMMPVVSRKQAGAARFASSFAPSTNLGIAFRNLVTRLFRFPILPNLFFNRFLQDEIELPDYAF